MITEKLINSLNNVQTVLLRTPMVLPKWNNTHSICPPLGLAYIASSLRDSGFDIRCIDALGEAPMQRITSSDKKFVNFGLSTSQILDKLSLKSFNVLFVSLMFSHEWPKSKKIINAIKKKYPNILLVCGGEHITACPELCLKECPNIDICVVGEGEETSTDLLNALEKKLPLNNVKGIVFSNNNEIIRTPNRSRISKQENIPWPAWDLFPIENYLSNGLGYGVNPGRTMPMLISRGCPFQCTFCSSPRMWTTKWQARNVDCVIDEMEFYIKKYKAQNFDFYDLTTIVRKDWIVDFCKKVINKNWKITWQMPAGTRSEALDDETLGLMVLSGQEFISYAPESGSEVTLRNIKKKIKIPTMKKSIKSALSKGLSVKLNLMMGFPKETHRHMLQTIKFVIDSAVMGVSDVYIASFAPYPGSELFDQLCKNGKIPKIDDEYFLNLTSYSDLLRSYSYSEHVGHRMLSVYRLGGMAMFYVINFLFHPKRIFTLFSNIINRKEESKLDKALIEMFDRFRAKGQKKPPSTTN